MHLSQWGRRLTTLFSLCPTHESLYRPNHQSFLKGEDSLGHLEERDGEMRSLQWRSG